MLSYSLKIDGLRKQGLFLFLVLLYRGGLDAIYRCSIVPFWDYQNFTYTPVAWQVFYSWLFLLFYSLGIYSFVNKSQNVTANVALLFFFIRLIPFTSLIACKEQSADFIFWESLYWILLLLFFKCFKPVKIPNMGNSDVWIYVLTLILMLTVIFISGYYTHFRLNFSLMNVYELRGEAREFGVPLPLNYLWPAATNILPILLIYYLQKGKRWVVCFIIFVIFLNFSITGSKSVLFKLLFCLFLYFFMKRNVLKLLPWLFLLLCAASLLENWLVDTNLISAMIIRRVLYIPVLLDSLYYDFLTQENSLFYTQGKDAVQFLIGEEYFGKAEMRANNGAFSDAFMNLKEWGCIIYPFLYAMFFKCCENAFRGINEQIVFFASLLIVTTLGSSEFTTALLTHGVFLLCLTLYLFPR